MQVNPEPPQERRFCRQCGSANPADATFCVSCGAPLSDGPVPDTIIDVSDGHPEILGQSGQQPPQPGQTVYRRSVIDIRATNRTCVLAVALFFLLICCACWVLTEIPQRLF